MRASILLVFLLGASACSRADSQTERSSMSDPITLAVVNARVWTGDRAGPWAEAHRRARRAARRSRHERRGPSGSRPASRRSMRADGSSCRASSTRTSTSSTAASGSPPCSCATRRRARSSCSRIKAFAATVPAGTWITGGDWDHSLWGGELPARDWIDAVTPNHPVWINRLDGHMALANSAALKAAGVTRATQDVAGGEIVRAPRRRADRPAEGQRDGARRQGRAAAVDGDARPRARGRDEATSPSRA